MPENIDDFDDQWVSSPSVPHPDPECAPGGPFAASDLAPSEDVQIADVVAAIAARSSDRDASGRFTKHNAASVKTWRDSTMLKADLAPLKADLVARVYVDLGLTADEVPEVMRTCIDMWAEATILRQVAFTRLSQQGGPITNKGRTRALLATWQTAFDRELRVAERIGLERRAKPAQSLHDWLTDTPDAETTETDSLQAQAAPESDTQV